jgi:hypothetical protein
MFSKKTDQYFDELEEELFGGEFADCFAEA